MPAASVDQQSARCLSDALVEDIEDIFKSAEALDDFQESSRVGTRRIYVLPKVKRRLRRTTNESSALSNPEPVVADSVIPGVHRIHVRTWGCAHNSSDSEYMSGQLAAYGYTIVDDKSEADLWLLNSCTVKNPAEDHFRNEINTAKKLGKHVVVAGCVAQSVPSVGYLGGLSIIGVHQIDRVVEVVEETLKGNTVRLLNKKKLKGRRTGGASLTLPKIRRNNLIEIIPISTGCLNHCTYCKTKHARGELGSYPVEAIVDRAKQAFEDGVCELWITSEDTGAYGIDIGSSLPELLWRLIEAIPDGCMLRLGMTNPPYILRHLEEMAKILAHPKVYSFLHVPVQSGSDPVLADMKREYCVEDFENVVDFLRERVPGLTVATDIICGFPTETDENFKETMALVEKYKFPSLFINQFYPRPGTPAARMQRIPSQDVKKRTKSISELFASYRPYDQKIGETQSVLVTELSTDKEHYIGHNKFYEQVLVPKDDRLMGHIVRVKIISTGKHYLIGELRPDEYGPPVLPIRPLVTNQCRPLTSSSSSNVLAKVENHGLALSLFDLENWRTLVIIGLIISYILCKLAAYFWLNL